MTPKKAVEIVTDYQKWRRGDAPYDRETPFEMKHKPAEIGEAIDCLLAMSRNLISKQKTNL